MCNHDPTRNLSIMITTILVPVVITITTTTIMTINPVACIFASLLLFRSGNRTFDFDYRYNTDLSSCGVVMVE